MAHNDLTFFTNEPDRDLYGRFSNILKSNTQFFDILVGYFRTSGFFKMYKAMESVEKIRVLGPVRSRTQIEILAGDGFKLGVRAPVRLSGDLAGTPGIMIWRLLLFSFLV